MPAKIVSQIVASVNVKFRADQSRPHWVWIWEDQVSFARIGLITDKIYLLRKTILIGLQARGTTHRRSSLLIYKILR